MFEIYKKIVYLGFKKNLGLISENETKTLVTSLIEFSKYYHIPVTKSKFKKGNFNDNFLDFLENNKGYNTTIKKLIDSI